MKSPKLLTPIAAFNLGKDYFYKHCLRYGTVTGYTDSIDADNKEVRIINVIVQGVHATITKRTGEVVACSYYNI